MGRLTNKVTIFFATAAISALKILKYSNTTAIFCLELTTVTAKIQLPYLSSGPLGRDLTPVKSSKELEAILVV